MSDLGRNIYDLDTPCLVIDLDVLRKNIDKMKNAAAGTGKHLRPHAKTHKCSTIARLQMEAGAIGLCVAKVSEAAALAKAGLNQILITGPIASPEKINRLVRLLYEAPSVMTVVDSHYGVALLDAALRAEKKSMDVLIDIDVGLHRTGISPDRALDLAGDILSRPALRLRGMQAYAGQVQHISSYESRKAASHQSLEAAAAVFSDLHTNHKTCSIFSSSGTGTFDIDLAVPEVTELQVGSYVCMDSEYLAIGSADNDTRFTAFEPALRLLTSVVSANQNGFVTVDAGLKTMYKDGGRPLVLGQDREEMIYEWFGDEYGMIIFPGSTKAPVPGTVIELVTSHCDPTVNLFDRYYVFRDEKVVDVWPIDLRGCSQ